MAPVHLHSLLRLGFQLFELFLLFRRQDLLDARSDPREFHGGVAFDLAELRRLLPQRRFVCSALDGVVKRLARGAQPLGDAGAFDFLEQGTDLLALIVAEVELAKQEQGTSRPMDPSPRNPRLPWFWAEAA